jgi:hypothetical protein
MLYFQLLRAPLNKPQIKIYMLHVEQWLSNCKHCPHRKTVEQALYLSCLILLDSTVLIIFGKETDSKTAQYAVWSVAA